jgi:hypothetical protein
MLGVSSNKLTILFTLYFAKPLKQENRIGLHFIKYDIQGVFLRCAEILPTRLWDNVED